MNNRIKKLREQSLSATNKISVERAVLITEFYNSNIPKQVSIPKQRALWLKYFLDNKKLCYNKGELIIGERGFEPKATPTYPEICLHSIKDLEILNAREKVSFKVENETKNIYTKTIIPFWKGRTQRERLFSQMSDKWTDAYNAGVFTEFQEQRAPGHTANGNKIYKKGLLDIIDDINSSINNLDFFKDEKAFEKREELQAMEIAAKSMIDYAKRNSDFLFSLANKESDKQKKLELENLANICLKVPANKPETLHEALQYYWFVHLGVISELNPWDSFNPGRLDQHLYPFYKNDLEKGILTKEEAVEILQSFWVKFNNHPAPPKIGITALESNTYTDFALINIGGLKPDGSNAVNEMSYILLDVIQEMRILQPSSMVQLSKKTPDNFIKRTVDIVKTGFGQPSIFNSDAIVQELLRQGKSVEDARNGGASGCVETGAFGTESYILTGYFNLAKILEITLNNGVDPKTNKKIGIETGNPINFKSFDELIVAFKKQENYFADIKIKGNNIVERLYADYMPVPYLSLFIDDCICNGKDYNNGGARYNTSYIQGVGLGSLTDIFTSLKFNVFDNKNICMEDMLKALAVNFKGYEKLRNDLIYNTPKYGNDDDYADEQAVKIFNIFYDSINGRPSARGGIFRINMLPTTCHIYFGSVINATADGRKASDPLSEGISPVQGADTKGPTAVIKSAAKIDHIKTGGTLLNQKFSPAILKTEAGLNNIVHLIRSYFKMDGHHIQFNVVSAKTLKEAQKHPEKYRDLIVRVAGYSDYFNDLGEDLQNEIIKRTEHESF
ncbi:MAG: glycyl radical protein [Bacteroidetes bacterium]|nr:glycyl radical protein [Bacteroidota bacterium]